MLSKLRFDIYVITDIAWYLYQENLYYNLKQKNQRTKKALSDYNEISYAKTFRPNMQMIKISRNE